MIIVFFMNNYVYDNCVYDNCVYDDCVYDNCVYDDCVYDNCVSDNCIFHAGRIWRWVKGGKVMLWAGTTLRRRKLI